MLSITLDFELSFQLRKVDSTDNTSYAGVMVNTRTKMIKYKISLPYNPFTHIFK